MVSLIVPNRQVDYRLEKQILEEVTDLVVTLRLHLHSDNYTGPTSFKRCVERRRKRMSTDIGKRICRDIIKHKNPVAALQEIIDRYLPEDKDEHTREGTENPADC